jgi:hypothetical protein
MVTTDTLSLNTTVRPGSRVRFTLNGDIEEWTIVPLDGEPDASRHLISAASPLGEALLDHSVGERVVADTPGGRVAVTILAISDVSERSTSMTESSPHLTLVTDGLSGVRHALPVGRSDGDTLCGVTKPVAGWRLAAATGTSDRIGCAACRALAQEVIAAYFLPRSTGT